MITITISGIEIKISTDSENESYQQATESCLKYIGTELDELQKKVYDVMCTLAKTINNVDSDSNKNNGEVQRETEQTPPEKQNSEPLKTKHGGRRKKNANDCTVKQQIKSVQNKRWKLKKSGELTPDVAAELDKTLSEIKERAKEPYQISD